MYFRYVFEILIFEILYNSGLQNETVLKFANDVNWLRYSSDVANHTEWPHFLGHPVGYRISIIISLFYFSISKWDKMIYILRKFISLSHKVALAATIRLFSTKIFSFHKVV